MNHRITYEPSLAPFVVQLTSAVIMAMRNKQFPKTAQESIHADMIPQFSDHVVFASMKQKTIPPRPLVVEVKPITLQRVPVQPNLAPKPPRMSMPSVSNPDNAWLKIEPFLRDPTVTHIECPGQNRPLMISRMGMRQGTKIILTDAEIKKIL